MKVFDNSILSEMHPLPWGWLCCDNTGTRAPIGTHVVATRIFVAPKITIILLFSGT